MPDYTPITAEIRARIAAIGGLTLIDAPEKLEEFGKDKTPGVFHRPELIVEATEVRFVSRVPDRPRHPPS